MMDMAKVFTERYLIAKKLNKRLQQYMGKTLPKPEQHSPLKDFPTFSDFFE